MMENAHEMLAVLSLTAASCAVGSLAVQASNEIARENTRTEVAVIKEEDEPASPDRNGGQPLDPTKNSKLAREATSKTYPVRRAYGRNGQLGNRTRGDVGVYARHR